MGKRRAEHPFEDNPFVDGFLEWMGSSEGEHSVDALDRVYAALEMPMSTQDSARSSGTTVNGCRSSSAQNAFMLRIPTCPKN
jgi:hypothetical protein